MGIAVIVTAATVMVLGYRAGRAHAAWKDVGNAKRAVRITRRQAWRHTITLSAGAVAVLATLLVAGFDPAH